MTDPIPAEAVEAAAWELAMELGHTVLDFENHRAAPNTVRIARRALTAAAPYIAAQATVDDPRKVAHIECGCVPDLGPSHCHLCSERVGREMPWTEAHPLRAGIEALRDEWQKGAHGRFENSRHPGTLGSCADALAALLRGVK